MRITIDAIDDAYFHLADKTESFGCKYHLGGVEVLYVHKMPTGEIDFYCPSTNNMLLADQETFERDFNILGHPIFLGQLIDIMDKRVNNMYTAVTEEAFARYVYLAKFIVDARTVKANPLEGACISEELFNNLIKLLGDFFDDPKPSEYKAHKEAEIAMETSATEKILSSKKEKGQTSKKQKKN